MVEKFVHLDMNYTFANSLVALSIMNVLVQVQSNNSLLGTIGSPLYLYLLVLIKYILKA